MGWLLGLVVMTTIDACSTVAIANGIRSPIELA